MLGIAADCVFESDCGGHMGAWNWLWMLGGWVIALGIVVAFVWNSRGPGAPEGEPPLSEILAAKFARGDISEQDYRRLRSVLEER